MKLLKIWWLKKQARRHYILAATMLDHVDCGILFYHYLRPNIAASKYKFNDLMNQLEKLGESVPDIRL